MNHPVLSALLPVVMLIAVGYFAGCRKWIGVAGVKDLSNLVFLVLTPALLFRTMSKVQVQQLDFRPVAAYFIAVGLILPARWSCAASTGAQRCSPLRTPSATR
jgi:malonate transporter and related proteins